jgi:peptidoglycan hydrolase-like protein with peptidoglycan-binding domain
MIDRLLRFGSQGDDVKHIQFMLDIAGAWFTFYQINGLPPPSLYRQLIIDGIFGPKTYKRVIEFQKKRFLEPDGIVGPITHDSLLALGVPDNADMETPNSMFELHPDPKNFNNRLLLSVGFGVLTWLGLGAGGLQRVQLGRPIKLPFHID